MMMMMLTIITRVPLSTNNDEDEWGWKDTHDNRDVESGLGNGGDNNTKHNSNLHHYHHNQQQQHEQQQQQLNNNNNDNSINMIETIPQRKDSWDEESAEWEEHEPIAQPATTTTTTTTTTETTTIPVDIIPPKVDTIEDILKNNFAGSTITSFSKPSPLTQQSIEGVTNKKKKVVKEEEEDIFASMGLSSIPSSKPKSSSTAVVKPKPIVTQMTPINPIVQQSRQELASSSLSAAYLTADDDDEPIDGGEKWGDDSDLDDLLED